MGASVAPLAIPSNRVLSQLRLRPPPSLASTARSTSSLGWLLVLQENPQAKQAGLTRQNPQNIKMADEEVDIDLADPEVFLCKIKTISSAQICTEKYF